jgi:hypothetical protein
VEASARSSAAQSVVATTVEPSGIGEARKSEQARRTAAAAVAAGCEAVTADALAGRMREALVRFSQALALLSSESAVVQPSESGLEPAS